MHDPVNVKFNKSVISVQKICNLNNKLKLKLN